GSVECGLGARPQQIERRPVHLSEPPVAEHDDELVVDSSATGRCASAITVAAAHRGSGLMRAPCPRYAARGASVDGFAKRPLCLASELEAQALQVGGGSQ